MYGILISLSILISLLIGEKLIQKKGLKKDIYWGSSLWTILGGVAGARIYHVIDQWNYYVQEPLRIVKLYEGGLGIYGAVIGGALGLALYLKVKKVKVLPYTDIAAVVLPLGQAIGRWGNYANYELYGKPTDLPWGLYIPLSQRLHHYKFNDMYHPLFLYESLLNLCLFLALLTLYLRGSLRRQKGRSEEPLSNLSGFFTLSYILAYGTARFALEGLRINPWVIGKTNVAGAFSLVFIVIGLIGLAVLYFTKVRDSKKF